MRRRSVVVFTVLVALTAACSGGSTHHATKPKSSTTVGQGGKGAKKQKSTTTTTRPDGGGKTHTVPSSIDATCRDDVTHDLQAWVDDLPDHITIAFGDHACYRVEGTLVLGRRDRIIVEGNGATLRATTAGSGNRLEKRARSQLSIVRSHDVTVRHLVVRGANPHAGLADDAYVAALEAQHAFNLQGDDGVTLDAVQAYDVYGDFVYVGGAGNTPSRNIVVRDSRFARNGRQGIAVTNGDGVQIVGNTVDDVRRSFVDLEPNTRAGVARNITIERNTTGRIRNYWLADKGVGSNVGNVTASHNVMQQPSGALVIVVGPKVVLRGPFTFDGNTFRTTASVTDSKAAGALLFVNVSGVTLRANRVEIAPAAHLAGVELRATERVSLAGNTFVGATRDVLADAASKYTG